MSSPSPEEIPGEAGPRAARRSPQARRRGRRDEADIVLAYHVVPRGNLMGSTGEGECDKQESSGGGNRVARPHAGLQASRPHRASLTPSATARTEMRMINSTGVAPFTDRSVRPLRPSA